MQSFPAINEVKYSLKRGAPIFRFFGMRDLPYFDADKTIGIKGLRN